MRTRDLALAALLACLALQSACKKPNPHDNARPPLPEPATENVVKNHRFDGGETNPYLRPGEKSGEGAGEGAAKAE